MNYSSNLNSLLDQISSEYMEEVAKEGLVLLRSLLAKSGFLDSEYLKDYELSSHMDGDSVVFEIIINESSISDSSINEVREISTPVNPNNLPGEQYTIPTIPSRAFASARRILSGGSRGGSYDARKSSKTSHDARVSASDARRDNRVTSSDRSLTRDASAPAPRNMRVDRQGKLVLAFRKQMEENGDTYSYPSGDFSGIVREFLEKLQVFLLEQFAPKLEEIITGNLS